jgi:hypothetical protein
MANEKDSFVRPLAEGLARLVARCGGTPEVYYDGLEILDLPTRLRSYSPRAVAGFLLKSRGHQRRFDDLVEKVSDADAVVVVAHVPASLSRRALQNVEELRKRLPEMPVVNYDLIYLPTVEKWSDAMLRDDLSDISPAERELIEPKPFGLERFDWYLVGSPASELPMPPGPQPFSHVGVNIDDGSLFPDQGAEFRVLLDFEQTRKDYPSFREVQVEALEGSGVPYEILEGRFTRSEIRAKYREAGALMLAHRESFGLPICEVQACGGQIFTPRAEWAGAHWMKEAATEPGPGEHSSNFVIYDNDVDTLVEQLQLARDTFDPELRLATFRDEQPHLLYGDSDEVSDFLEKVDSGYIHSRLHAEHRMVGR